jgi:hypothetical protein
MSGKTTNANYFIAWWSAVYSRLAYLNPQEFLGRYTEIFGDTKGTVNLGTTVNDGSGGALPTTSVLDMMNKQAVSTRIMGLLDDKTMLGLTNAAPNQKRWGLNVIEVDGINASPKTPTTLTLDCITNYGPDGQALDAYGEASQVASWAEKVNIILGERRKMLEDKKNPASSTPEMVNCAPALVLKDNSQLVFRAISDSNYGTTYVFGDKRAPNLVWVVFRGTANAKSALAYTRPSSLVASAIANFYGTIEKGLIGIFKILEEQIHMILQMAVDVAQELNPGVQLAPGSMKLLTTGHSLGGAMATAFAGEYVQQISRDLPSIGAGIFDVNIGCYSLASPRVFGPNEAAWFCCLTQASALCNKNPETAARVKADANIKGRISYLRVVTTLDIVTALPKIGYEHPCSEFKDGERDKITMDCDIEASSTAFVKTKIDTRCATLLHKRPSMKAGFDHAPVCTDARKKTWSPSTLLYHLSYCGIMFAGGVDMNSALSLDVERLQQADVQTEAITPAIATSLGLKADDTMMRILWYGFMNSPVAKCVFFDLAPFRVKEIMAQGGGGINQKGGWPFSKAKVTPVDDSGAAVAAPAKSSFFSFGKPKTPAPAPATGSSVAAATGAASGSSVAAPSGSATSDSSVLFEDTRMTSQFLVILKQAIAANPKYDYPITNGSIKPPILYKPSKGQTTGVYDYLYPLPNIKITTRHVLFFGKDAPAAPVRQLDSNGQPVLTADEQADLQRHNIQVAALNTEQAKTEATAALVSAQSAVATTTVAPATVATATVAPATTAAPAATTTVAPAPVATTTAASPAVAPVAAVAPVSAAAPVAAAPAPVAATTTVAPAPVATTTVAAPAVAPATAAATTGAPAATNGGRRTRRNKSNNRSRKHRKGKGKKGARISRRGNKRHTKRH